MNSLSWLLYWADTLPSLATAIGVVCTLAALATGVTLIANIVSTCSMEYEGDDAEKISKGTMFSRWLLPLLVTVALLTHLVPEKQTFYLIAGSEMGQQALSTPEFEKIRKVINTYLDDALDTGEDKEEESK